MTNQDIILMLQFIPKNEQTILAFQQLRAVLIQERAYAIPSTNPEDQMKVHAELAFSYGQIELVDRILETLTLPPIPTESE